jgi:hypothetical protein
MGKKETANPIEYVVNVKDEVILDKDDAETITEIADAIDAVFTNANNRKDPGATRIRIGGVKNNC